MKNVRQLVRWNSYVSVTNAKSKRILIFHIVASIVIGLFILYMTEIIMKTFFMDDHQQLAATSNSFTTTITTTFPSITTTNLPASKLEPSSSSSFVPSISRIPVITEATTAPPTVHATTTTTLIPTATIPANIATIQATAARATNEPTTLYPTIVIEPQTALPTTPPTSSPTMATLNPTVFYGIPTKIQTETPSNEPSTSTKSDETDDVPPTTFASNTSGTTPTKTNTNIFSSRKTTTFYAIGDVPYDMQQQIELKQQMLTMIPNDAEFVIHIGDVRSAEDNTICESDEYSNTSSILRLSRVPVFIILGDNDWNDCPNADDGLKYWHDEFLYFESKYWEHSFQIERQVNYPSNFAFVNKGTLFIGLNIVGGKVLSMTEWKTRLTDQVVWTIDIIRKYIGTNNENSNYDLEKKVVLFGHANPKKTHLIYFFDPFCTFIQTELNNSVPILYMNGDQHKWAYNTNYMNRKSFVRIMVAGRTVDPPLKVMIDSITNSGVIRSISDQPFKYDRRLTETQS